MIAAELSKIWHQPVVVENMPGASQSIAADYVAKSPADRYTLLLVPNITGAVLRKKVPFDLENDLAPLALLTTSAGVLVVTADLPAKDIKQLIELAKASPGKLSYGSAGIGSPGHFQGELFNMMAGTDIVNVPFKSGVDTVTAVANGEIQIAYPGVAGTEGLIESGKIRPLAVTSKTRLVAMPDTPTL